MNVKRSMIGFIGIPVVAMTCGTPLTMLPAGAGPIPTWTVPSGVDAVSLIGYGGAGGATQHNGCAIGVSLWVHQGDAITAIDGANGTDGTTSAAGVGGTGYSDGGDGGYGPYGYLSGNGGGGSTGMWLNGGLVLVAAGGGGAGGGGSFGGGTACADGLHGGDGSGSYPGQAGGGAVDASTGGTAGSSSGGGVAGSAGNSWNATPAGRGGDGGGNQSFGGGGGGGGMSGGGGGASAGGPYNTSGGGAGLSSVMQHSGTGLHPESVFSGGALPLEPGAYVLSSKITSPSVPTGTAGTPFSASLHAKAQTTRISTGVATTSQTSVQWTISPALPDGLSLNSTTGVISGTPSTGVDAEFTVTAGLISADDPNPAAISHTSIHLTIAAATVTTQDQTGHLAATGSGAGRSLLGGFWLVSLGSLLMVASWRRSRHRQV